MESKAFIVKWFNEYSQICRVKESGIPGINVCISYVCVCLSVCVYTCGCVSV